VLFLGEMLLVRASLESKTEAKIEPDESDYQGLPAVSGSPGGTLFQSLQP